MPYIIIINERVLQDKAIMGENPLPPPPTNDACPSIHMIKDIFGRLGKYEQQVSTMDNMTETRLGDMRSEVNYLKTHVRVLLECMNNVSTCLNVSIANKAKIEELEKYQVSQTKHGDGIDLTAQIRKLVDENNSYAKKNDLLEKELQKLKYKQDSMEKENYIACTRMDRDETDLIELKEKMCLHSESVKEVKKNQDLSKLKVKAEHKILWKKCMEIDHRNLALEAKISTMMEKEMPPLQKKIIDLEGNVSRMANLHIQLDGLKTNTSVMGKELAKKIQMSESHNDNNAKEVRELKEKVESLQSSLKTNMSVMGKELTEKIQMSESHNDNNVKEVRGLKEKVESLQSSVSTCEKKTKSVNRNLLTALYHKNVKVLNRTMACQPELDEFRKQLCSLREEIHSFKKERVRRSNEDVGILDFPPMDVDVNNNDNNTCQPTVAEAEDSGDESTNSECSETERCGLLTSDGLQQDGIIHLRNMPLSQPTSFHNDWCSIELTNIQEVDQSCGTCELFFYMLPLKRHEIVQSFHQRYLTFHKKRYRKFLELSQKRFCSSTQYFFITDGKSVVGLAKILAFRHVKCYAQYLCLSELAMKEIPGHGKKTAFTITNDSAKKLLMQYRMKLMEGSLAPVFPHYYPYK